MKIAVFLALLALSGCASAEQIAAADNAKCQSFGATPGTPTYVECRMEQDRLRARRRPVRVLVD